MAGKKKEKGRLRRKITNKFRLVILNEETFQERLSFKLNLLNIFVFGGVFSIFLVALTSVIIAFTPLKEYIPGYDSTRLKRKATQLVFQTDSLKNRLLVLQNFTRSLMPVLTGEHAVTEPYIDSLKDSASMRAVDFNVLDPTKADSLFRESVDSKDRFPLLDKATNKIDIVFFAPVTGTITQAFEPNNKHYAIDIVAVTGTPVKAIEEGTVIFSEWTADTGYVLILEHSNGFISTYKHNGSLLKQQGDFVRSGEVIARVGSTGDLSTGPHLHFELWYNGYPVNPINYIDFQ